MDIKLAQIVVGVEILRIELDRLAEFHSGRFRLYQAHQVGRQVGPGGCGIRFQAHRLPQMRAGFRVLRLRGIDQAQELMDIEAGRDLAQQALQFDCRLGEAARFVLRYSRLEFTVEVLSGLTSGRCQGYADQSQNSRPNRRASHGHVFVCYHRAGQAGGLDLESAPPAGAPVSALPGEISSSLEVQLQSELDLSRIIRGITSRADRSKVRARVVVRTADGHDTVATESGRVEVRVIENVEELGTELQLEALRELEVFEEREIQPVEARSGNLGWRTTQNVQAG